MTANSSKSTLMGLIPGKDQGAGDSETPEIPKELRDDALNMELLQASLSGLEFPNSAHGSKPMTHDMRPDNETEEDLDTSDPEDDESGIEPLCSYPYVGFYPLYSFDSFTQYNSFQRLKVINIIPRLQGYIKRQTVYVCLTCNDPSQEGWQPAGVCIGCRHACHKNHDVVSLETRRLEVSLNIFLNSFHKTPLKVSGRLMTPMVKIGISGATAETKSFRMAYPRASYVL